VCGYDDIKPLFFATVATTAVCAKSFKSAIFRGHLVLFLSGMTEGKQTQHET